MLVFSRDSEKNANDSCFGEALNSFDKFTKKEDKLDQRINAPTFARVEG